MANNEPGQKSQSVKSDLPEWARTPLVHKIFTAARELGGEARIVGGAVRNWLAIMPVADIDMAINLPIEQVSAHCAKAGMRVIETGLKHGTITLVDARGAIELTQTRVDVETDGRHAIVAHKADWAADAARRDFTINAIYLDQAGVIFDPFDGQTDLAARRLRFVGDAAMRVQEDALRMLRYCRFFQSFSADKVDPEAQAALSAHGALSGQLSGERVASEMRRIMRGDRLFEVVELMRITALDEHALGVPLHNEILSPHNEASGDETSDFGVLFRDMGKTTGWLAGLAVLMPVGSAEKLATRLRVSRAESVDLKRLDKGLSDQEMAALNGPKWPRIAYYLGPLAVALYAVQSLRNGTPVKAARLMDLKGWTPPELPINGADLLSHGVDNGPALGQLLSEAERRWVGADFALDKAALLAWLIGN